MKVSFRLSEIKFLKESLVWWKRGYTEKATPYFNQEGYREKIYNPTIKMYDDVMAKLRAIKKKGECK